MLPKVPLIIFVRTRLPLSSMPADSLSYQRPEDAVGNKSLIDETGYMESHVIYGENTLVYPELLPEGPVRWQEKTTLEHEYSEAIAVSPVMAAATPFESSFNDDEDHVGWSGPYEDRASAEIAKVLNVVVPDEKPSFGRRILLVNFEDDLDDRALERTKQRIRRQLGGCNSVWQGRTFEAYCFVDNRTPHAILEPMYDILDCDEIEDYLLVQPTNMALADKSGLSPLADWMICGYKQQRVNTRGRRSGRSSRQG